MRGEALIHLGRNTDAHDELRRLFGAQHTLPVYLKLRQVAQKTNR